MSRAYLNAHGLGGATALDVGGPCWRGLRNVVHMRRSIGQRPHQLRRNAVRRPGNRGEVSFRETSSGDELRILRLHEDPRWGPFLPTMYSAKYFMVCFLASRAVGLFENGAGCSRAVRPG